MGTVERDFGPRNPKNTVRAMTSGTVRVTEAMVFAFFPHTVSVTLTPPMRQAMTFLFLLLGSFSAWARNTNDQWIEIRSPHFVVLTDTNEKQGRRVASQFERMRTLFHILMPAAADSPGSPIIVLALKDRKAFQALEPEAYLAKGQLDLAGFFSRAPDKNYILLRLDAQGEHPYATVYHEYTHYMLRNAGEWLPLWLNEGLAEFYQNTQIFDKEVRLGQADLGDIYYLRQNRLLPLTTLLKVDATSPYYHEEQKGSVFYAESWALTHYLEINDAKKGTSHLQEYANLLEKKQDPVVAAQQAFGDLKQLQSALDGYVAQASFMEFKMNKAVPVDEAAFQARPIPTTDADAIRADVLVCTQRTHDAQALIDAVLQQDPNNALAHETMGYLKFREGDIPTARKWFGEAVKLDSQSYLANYYYGAMSLRSGGADDDPQIESSLRIAIKLNPQFAPAYDALAMYLSRDPAKSAEAHMLNIQAITLEPDNLNYRLNAAVVLMNQQHSEGALGVLKAAMKVARTPDQVITVQMRIDQIQQYKAGVERSRETQNVTATVTGSDIARTIDGRTVIRMPYASPNTPKYPTEAPDGKRHTASGVLRGVRCTYPSVLTMTVQPPGTAEAVSLYRNDFKLIEFSATNFSPKGNLDPCHDIEGMKAKVAYAEVSDKSIAGQILSVELSK
jgi:tetratricopeptide (TPR) repeat protein